MERITVAVGGRYRSRIGEMMALEDEMEMKALRESGILDSVRETLSEGKTGCVVFCGTGGDIKTLEEAAKTFKA
jgi:hypothetical protein